MIRNVPVWFFLSHEVFRLRAAINRHLFQLFLRHEPEFGENPPTTVSYILRFAHVIWPAGSAPVWSAPPSMLVQNL